MESWPTARRWDVGTGALGTDAVKGRPPVGNMGMVKGDYSTGMWWDFEGLVMDGRDSSATLGMTWVTIKGGMT